MSILKKALYSDFFVAVFLEKLNKNIIEVNRNSTECLAKHKEQQCNES